MDVYPVLMNPLKGRDGQRYPLGSVKILVVVIEMMCLLLNFCEVFFGKLCEMRLIVGSLVIMF